MRILCSKKESFIIQHLTVRNNQNIINECLEIFYKARNVDKVRHWKKLHATMKDMSIMTMGHTTVLHCITNLKNNNNIESFKIKSDNCFVLRRRRK